MPMRLHKQLRYKERDFEKEYLFRTCSVVTNLETSLESVPTHCATMLCHFGHTWSGSVATHFIHLSSTVMSSATGGYVAVPERFGQKEETAGRTKERTKNKPSSGSVSKI